MLPGLYFGGEEMAKTAKRKYVTLVNPRDPSDKRTCVYLSQSHTIWARAGWQEEGKPAAEAPKEESAKEEAPVSSFDPDKADTATLKSFLKDNDVNYGNAGEARLRELAKEVLAGN